MGNSNQKDEHPMTTTVDITKVPNNASGTELESQSHSAPASGFRKFGGILFALAASIFFSLTFLDLKILQRRGFLPFGSAVLFNLGVILPSAIIVAFYDLGFGHGQSEVKRKKILSEIWPLSDLNKRSVFKLLTVQGLLQAASVVFRACALQYLDIGDMTVIVFSSPILTTFIAHFVVHEPCAIIFIFIAIYTFCGVVLITKPPMLVGGEEFDSLQLIGMALAAGALISLSMQFVVTRKIQNTNLFLMTLFLGLTGFLVSFPLFLIFEEWSTIVPKDGSEWLLVLGLLGAFCSYASIATALKLENAGPVALIRSLDVLFAFLLQFIFLNVVPDLLSSIGALIVVSGVLTVGVRKWLLSTKFGQAHCGCCE